MKQSNGTSLEFNFYFAGLPEPEPFIRVVESLLDLGAKFGGDGLVSRGEDINGKPFTDAFDPEPHQIEINDRADFLELINNPDRRLIEISMTRAIYSQQDLVERVTYLSIPQKAAFSNNHPIAVWSLWDTFSGIPEEYFEPKAKFNQYTQIARKKGREVYLRFLALLFKLKPTYAAITIESFLACPVELRAGPTGLPLSSFYLSNEYFSPEDFARVQELYTGAYFENIPGGLYVSGYPYFNPAGKELDFNKTNKVYREVEKLIGKRVK